MRSTRSFASSYCARMVISPRPMGGRVMMVDRSHRKAGRGRGKEVASWDAGAGRAEMMAECGCERTRGKRALGSLGPGCGRVAGNEGEGYCNVDTVDCCA